MGRRRERAMCRMLAAVGRFDAAPLVAGLRAMAMNRNPPHRHEYSGRGGDFVHADGWGAVWEDAGRLVSTRGTPACFEDPALDRLAEVRTERLVLHARRGTGDAGVRLENTHPFVARHDGAEWAYCHNGTVRDTSSLRELDGVTPQGGTDSERLFHHLLASFDAARPEASVAAALDAVRDYSCLNSFLLTPGRLLYAARAEEGTGRPEYYTLWRARGDGFSIVSSEPLPELGLSWFPSRRAVAELTGPRRGAAHH
jgi:glutamine amidotransferase